VGSPHRFGDGISWAMPSTEKIERSKTMIKRSRPKIGRQVEDKSPQGALPDDNKSQVKCKEAQDPSDEPVAQCLVVEDEDWIELEYECSRLKQALGIDDDDFCMGILRQLEKLTNFRHWADRCDFNFVLSVLKDARPVDKLHAMIYVQIAVCQLAVMKQAEVLLKPVRFELPADFQSAIHNARYDTSRLDKQKIKVDDLPVRQSGERAFSRLMQTFVQLVQISIAYRNAAELSMKGRQVWASADGQRFLSDTTEAVRHKAQKRGLNGSGQSAAGFADRSKSPNSNKIQKTNGRASS
jgi:hypothetical protein